MQVKIYQALDSETDRPVIIKLLYPNRRIGANTETFQKFRQVTTLRHPYIAHVYEVGLVDNRLFLAMESLDNRTLADYLAQLRAANKVLSLSTVSRHLKLIADALDYAHTQGIVHGNLNPSNILLTDVDEPILTDFGLAAMLIGDTAQYRPDGSDLGLSVYTSPEQAKGRPGDMLSDLYSLGVILYELVAGRPPFEAGWPNDLLAQHHSFPAPPRTFNSELPEATQAVILKALAKKPARRFAGAGELSKAFASALSAPPLVAPAISKEQAGSPMPQKIGRYKVEAELGRRGDLIVYQARDLKLDRQVAIKILLPQFVTSDEFRAHFQREVELIAALEHQCIVEVYDFGEYEGRPYVVMPYLAGGTLETRLHTGPLNLQSLTPIIERVATALDEAHTRDIIHSQIMPGNILFDAEGQAYLSDFNISAMSETWTDLTDREQADKASKYMSPEQVHALVMGEASQPDARSDVYALGVVVFEALTGQVPYLAGTAYETAMAHLTAPIPSLHDANPELPQEYQVLIDRTLAKKPADRYPTAGAMADRMKELLSGRWYMGKISSLMFDTLDQPTNKQVIKTTAPTPSQSQMLTDTKFDRYRLRRELGHGGMGVVYLAYDPTVKRQVAIKMLLCELTTTPGFRERFQYEAKLIARFDHDNIAHIYDFGEYDEQPFIVMRYLSGGTLADKLAQGALNLRQIAPIIERVAAALDAAHAQNIIHQDIKPGNILFNSSGEAFLSDFGIAVIRESTTRPATEDNIGGTPKYMSPEQVKIVMKKMDRKKLDGRSDIYSLGVVLFEMLTGQVPYQAGSPRETALAHLTNPVPRLDEIKPDLPAACQEIVDRVLAKEPAKRYQTAQELAKDVKELAAGRWFLRRLIE